MGRIGELKKVERLICLPPTRTSTLLSLLPFPSTVMALDFQNRTT
jgi:hypothetical protein